MPLDARDIGLLGVGLLGSAVAQRLLAAGYTVIAFDPSPAAQHAALTLGAETRASPAVVAAECRLLVACLPDGPSVSEAVLDRSRTSILKPGSLLIDLTTCAPAESRVLAEILARVDVAMLDAPVSGGSRQIAEGRGLLMVGGAETAFQRGEPVLSAISERVRYLGPSGSGSVGKLVTNLVLGLNRLALAEGLALAEACGLELPSALALLRESAAYSRAMDVKGARMTERRYDEPEARLRQHLKDVHLILELAQRQGVALPVSHLHAEILADAVAEGLGEADNAAVFEQLRPRNPSP